VSVDPPRVSLGPPRVSVDPLYYGIVRLLISVTSDETDGPGA